MNFVEQVYKASNGINVTYIEDPFPVQNKSGLEKLIVIFQSLGNEKSNDIKERYPYTLLAGLKFYNCRKIYIKDDIGHVGNYYLGINGKFDVMESVQEFIDKKINDYKLSKDQIIFHGNSKGAYASLVFGFKLGIKNIVAAIPQYRLYDWIKEYKPFLNYILPNEITEDVKDLYNNYLEKIIRDSSYKPNVYLITSKKDETFNQHIMPLIVELKNKACPLYIYDNEDESITKHNNVVINSLNEILCIISMLLSNKDMSQFFENND